MINDPARGIGRATVQPISAIGREALPPNPARGIAKVFIGTRSGLRIPEGPPVESAISVDELELMLAGLRESV